MAKVRCKETRVVKLENRYDGSFFVLSHRCGYYGSAASVSQVLV